MARRLRIGKFNVGPECGFRWTIRSYWTRPYFRRTQRGLWIGPFLFWWED